MNTMANMHVLPRKDPDCTRFEMADGTMFDPIEPRPELMELETIAIALSNSCRFGGHVVNFYSTAQHSVLVALLAPQDMPAQRMALLHDADESFGLPDMITPVKRLFPTFRAAQAKIGAAVEIRFGLDPADHARVKPADRQALLLEKMALKDPRNRDYWMSWSGGVEIPDGIEIVPLLPDAARGLFLAACDRVFRNDLPIDAEWLSRQDGFKLTGLVEPPCPLGDLP